MSRISYRSAKPLSYFNSIEKGLNYQSVDKDFFNVHGEDFINEFNNNKQFFKKNIVFVSDNFKKATDLASKKLKEMYLDLIHTEKHIILEGTYVINGNFYMIKHHKKESFSTSELSLFVFEKDGVPLVFDYMRTEKDAYKAWVTNMFTPINNDNISDIVEKICAQALIDIALIVMFRKYAKVEIVESKAKSKQTFAGCKYLNETDLDIEYLDSRWFTALVNSQGFKVRGFFRLQPKKKDGEWTKELIWIDEFEKHGYSRQAKILNNKPL